MLAFESHARTGYRAAEAQSNFRPDWEHEVGKVLLGFALDHITTAAELADIIDTRRAWTSKGPLQV